MNRTLTAAAAILLSPLALLAQQAAAPAAQPETNPVSNAVRRIVERQAKSMVAAAEAMPAEKYGFKSTPDQMTFGHLMIHTAGTNNYLCSSISGNPAPADEKLSETDPKDRLVAALKASFDYCTQALAKMDDSNLGEQVPFFGGRKVSRATAMIVLTDAFADHYGMAAIYLRLNGVLPPTAQPKKE
jgi:DinB superfamily